MNGFLNRKNDKEILYAHTKLFIRLAVIVIVLFCSILPLLKNVTKKKEELEFWDLGEVWTINLYDETFENVSLKEFKAKELLNKGDVMTMECDLPVIGIHNPVIRIYSVHSTVSVKLDDTVIYEYGMEDMRAGKMLGYGNHFVTLPQDFGGKHISVEYHITENDAFDGLPYSYLINASQISQNILSENTISLAIDMTLIVIGVCFGVLSFIMLVRDADFFRVFCISYFSLLAGIWGLCNMDLISLFTDNLNAKVGLEYLSLYMMPVPFLYYFKSNFFHPSTPKAQKVLFVAVMTALVGLFAVVMITFKQNVAHLSEYLKVSHILIGVGAVLIVWNMCTTTVKRKNTSMWMLWGLLAALGIIVLELIRFNVGKYFVGFGRNEYTPTLPFASFLIVLSMFLDYMDYNLKNLTNIAEKNVLKRLAFIDPLTGLGNRNALSEHVEKIENKPDYIVVNLDMNCLKPINDTFGHEAGDEALKMLATALKNSFSEIKDVCVARVGGDEFVIISEKADKTAVDECMEQVIKGIEAAVIGDGSIPLTIAMGIAQKKEISGNVTYKEVYDLADLRMYEYKAEFKKAHNLISRS